MTGADWVAVYLMFSSAEDLRPARRRCQGRWSLHTPIIAKIEHPAALDNLHSILDSCGCE